MRGTNNRKIRIAELPVNGGKVKRPGNKAVVQVEVYYNEGGANMFAGTYEQRGIYLSVTPVEIEQTDTPGVVIRLSSAFSGTKTCIEPATRFNRRRLEALAETAMQHEKYPVCLAHVLNKNGIELIKTTPEPAPAQ